MEASTSSDEVFEVNTKGLCILCLKDGCSTFSSNNGHTSPFKMLLRYLKINTYKMCNFSSSFLQSMDAMEDTSVVVVLCSDCGEMTEMFSKLYQDMENIRLRLDSCLQVIHDAMWQGKQSKTRTSEYQRRMRSRNMYEMFNANVAENLRNEAMKKCSEKVSTLVPRVLLPNHDRNSLTTFFGFPSSYSTQQRKIPGPKSKTQFVSGPSKLKALLTHQRDDRTQDSNQTKISLLDTGNSSSTYDKSGSKNISADPISCEEGLDYSEEFVIKAEPIYADVDHDIVDNFHNENDTSETNNEFEVENPSVIANFDGQLIGHFLGGEKTEMKTLSSHQENSINMDASSEEKGNVFPCSFCSKSFSSAAQLRGHLQIHKNRHKTGVKNSKLGGVKKHALKKKFRCTACKKSFSTQKTYRAHLKRFHQDSDINAFNCEVCGKHSFSHTIHQTHMISLHSLYVFSKYVPPETTEDQLDAAIQGVMADHREILDPNKKKSKLYGCQFCVQVHPHPSHLRLHLLRRHFDKILVMLQKFNGGVEFETINENYRNDVAVNSGAAFINESDMLVEDAGADEEEKQEDVGDDEEEKQEDGDVTDVDGEKEEEEEVEVEAQPILLSEAYSLTEGGEAPDIQKEIQNEYNSDISEDPLDMYTN